MARGDPGPGRSGARVAGTTGATGAIAGYQPWVPGSPLNGPTTFEVTQPP